MSRGHCLTHKELVRSWGDTGERPKSPKAGGKVRTSKAVGEKLALFAGRPDREGGGPLSITEFNKRGPVNKL